MNLGSIGKLQFHIAPTQGRAPGPWAGRLVAIDARVQRRPPRALVREEDAAVERTAELVLNDAQVCCQNAVRVLSECCQNAE